jgi:hypothetical protein
MVDQMLTANTVAGNPAIPNNSTAVITHAPGGVVNLDALAAGDQTGIIPLSTANENVLFSYNPGSNGEVALTQFIISQITGPALGDGPFLVRYASNLNLGDSVINFTNTGNNPGAVAPGDICVNSYAIAPDEEELSCCACRVTKNALWSLSVKEDIFENVVLDPNAVPVHSVVIKLLASQPTGAGQTGCDPSAPGAPVNSIAAWGTTLHNVNLTPAGTLASDPDGGGGPQFLFGRETPFQSATLSAQEEAFLTSNCGFIKSNQSGTGICRSCNIGVTRFTNPPVLGPRPNPNQNQGLSGNKQ